jgi:large subunit ribosomal protein L25
MPTKDCTLHVESRQKLGTTGANALRRAGKIPAVVYGHGTAPDHVAIEARAFEELLHHGGRTAIVTLDGGAKKNETVVVRNVQLHPVTHRVVHTDFQRVSADETIHAQLSIATVGVPNGVRNFGGVMDVIVHSLDVEGPASRIPDHLEVDVERLGIHEHLTAGDVALPNGFKMLTPAETIVVSVAPSRTERELEEGAVAAEIQEPEVIGATPAPGEA